MQRGRGKIVNREKGDAEVGVFRCKYELIVLGLLRRI